MLNALLLGFVVSALAPSLARRIGAVAGWMLALFPAGVALYAASFVPTVAAGRLAGETVRWVSRLGVDVSWRLDGLGVLMLLLIYGIGALILVYTGAYLKGSAGLGRLYAALLAFMSAMAGISVADNLLMLFVFWEITSVTSYLLIGTNHEREEARAAALQALLVTGGGGLALLAGIVLLCGAAGTYEVSQMLARADAIRAHALYAPATILILIGAFAKSAQVPLHFWLPGAMGAPTPVSAYLHSATMVKAGVFLLARMTPVLGGTDLWNGALTFFGAATFLAGSLMALRETDMKRILAYSTVGSLGAMTLLLGIGTEGAVKAAIVFLLAHGLYKGALFLVAGILDHETGTRDATRLSGLRRAMPVTAVAGVLAAASTGGLPPFGGFLAKEVAYEALLAAPNAAVAWMAIALLAN
ncbi:MAG: hypothetical protein FJX78_02115, partial [Armatimonadetes bacterium]|nr:hypothetical protein [Armatimonadota bacterium]